MSLHTLKISQSLPTSLETAWDFISSPRNLKKSTSPAMGFDIVSPDLPEIMYPGLLIAYNVKPLLGISMRWVSEISHIETMRYFIDEQRVGPYRFWHHEHHLEARDGGVAMNDIIHYEAPWGILGG